MHSFNTSYISYLLHTHTIRYVCILLYTMLIQTCTSLTYTSHIHFTHILYTYTIDSVLNHEVVKYFTNENKELNKFNTYLQRIQQLNIDSTYAIAILNFGQATLFCAGLTASLVIALNRVSIGVMSVGK